MTSRNRLARRSGVDLFGASVAGPAHRALRRPNEDQWFGASGPFGSLVVVSDGLGSKSQARHGAKKACIATLRAVRAWHKAGTCSIDDLVGRIEPLWLEEIAPFDRADCAATCLLALAHVGGWAYLAALGDGMVAVRVQGVIERVDPTPRQIEAIRVALNTPDIALIQGPPGTGKTKTIAALQARLAELGEDGDLAGQTLLTSYQHDAVENAAARTLVFGLPAIKVGRKHGRTDDGDGFDRWRRERVDGIRADLARLPERPVSEVLRKVRSMSAAYHASRFSPTETTKMVRDIEDIARPYLSPSLLDRLLAIRQELSGKQDGGPTFQSDDRDLLLKAIRGLRVDAISFGDDGPRNATRVLHRLELLGACDGDALRLRANAMFLKLIPPIAQDAGARSELEQSISRTIRPSPEAALRASKWLVGHLKFGAAWARGVSDGTTLRVGGYCRVPGMVEEPRVVLEVSDSLVGFWDYDRIRSFARDRVVAVMPAADVS